MRRILSLLLIILCFLISCESPSPSKGEPTDNPADTNNPEISPPISAEELNIPSWLIGTWYQEGTNSKSETFTRYIFTNNKAVFESGIDSKINATTNLAYKSTGIVIDSNEFLIRINEENSYLFKRTSEDSFDVTITSGAVTAYFTYLKGDRYKVSLFTKYPDYYPFEIKTVIYGEKYGELPTPLYHGYIFDGWYYFKGDETHNIDSNSIVSIKGNHRLYGRWKGETCQYTFNATEGKFSDNENSKTIIETVGEDVILPKIPTREGYTFLGWYRHSENGESLGRATFVSISNYDYGDETFFAHWKINTNESIRFYTNGGRFSDGSEVISITEVPNTKYVVPETPKRNGYSFVGWADACYIEGHYDTAKFIPEYFIPWYDECHSGNLVYYQFRSTSKWYALWEKNT